MEGTRKRKLVVLELYSGIGGMHYALEESEIPFEVVAAVDINEISNSIYQHNFPRSRLLTKCLTTLTPCELNSFQADVVTMSPPCQPFTRVGKQRDIKDERTKSLLHFLDLLPKIEKCPSYILLENVKGFETSLTRNVLLNALGKLNFVFQEFLLSPRQFSIPNSRLRYYLLAKRKPLEFSFQTRAPIVQEFPKFLKFSDDPMNVESCPFVSSSTDFKGSHSPSSGLSEHSRNSDGVVRNSFDCICNTGSDHDPGSPFPDEEEDPALSGTSLSDTFLDNGLISNCRNLQEYLEDKPMDYFDQFMVPRKFYRYFWAMDLVDKDSASTCCFTKRYGRHVVGAGSVLQMNLSQRDLTEYRHIKTSLPADYVSGIDDLQLRFFTPREISNLMCFPQNFKFPDGVTTIQSYRALGNSINVRVVSILLKLLID